MLVEMGLIGIYCVQDSAMVLVPMTREARAFEAVCRDVCAGAVSDSVPSSPPEDPCPPAD